MASLFDLVAMTVSSAPGTGSVIPLGSAATLNGVSYLSFSGAGTAGGTSVDYSLLDPLASGSEMGTITYLSSNNTLSGRTPTKSTNGNAAIAASSAVIVLCSPRAETLNDTSSLTTGLMAQARLGTNSGGAGLKALADNQNFALAMFCGVDVTLTDLNTIITDGFWFIEANCTNQPVAATQYFLLTQKYPLGSGYMQQTAWDLTPSGGMWTRGQLAGGWSSWVRVMVGANNLSEIASASTARTNLGLATIAATGSASDLASGTVATARLGSGAASSTTALFGDQTYKAITATGRYLGRQLFTSSNASITAPAGATQCAYRMQAPGGGSGGNGSITTGQSPSGAGAYIEGYIAVLNGNLNYTQGAAGAGGAASNGSTGSAGGTSTLAMTGITTASAAGGTGGIAGGTSANTAAPTLSNTSTDFGFVGPGSQILALGGCVQLYVPGFAFLASGGRQFTTSTTGTAQTNTPPFLGYGNGAVNAASTNHVGNAGGVGVLIVDWYT